MNKDLYFGGKMIDRIQDAIKILDELPHALMPEALESEVPENIDAIKVFLQQQELEKKSHLSSFGTMSDICIRHSKEIQRLKDKLDEYNYKFEVGQEVWILKKETLYTTVKYIPYFNKITARKDKYICGNYSVWLNPEEIFATREEAEQAREAK